MGVSHSEAESVALLAFEGTSHLRAYRGVGRGREEMSMPIIWIVEALATVSRLVRMFFVNLYAINTSLHELVHFSRSMNLPPLANLGCLGSLMNSSEFIDAWAPLYTKPRVMSAISS